MSDLVHTVRYQAYAAAHGRQPLDMLSHDRRRFPGGRMAGFLVWLDAQWREFGVDVGARSITDGEHAAFDAWLTERGGQ